MPEQEDKVDPKDLTGGVDLASPIMQMIRSFQEQAIAKGVGQAVLVGVNQKGDIVMFTHGSPINIFGMMGIVNANMVSRMKLPEAKYGDTVKDG